jgi:hypothetical protein
MKDHESLTLVNEEIVKFIRESNEVFGFVGNVGHELFPDKANPAIGVPFVEVVGDEFGYFFLIAISQREGLGDNLG